MPDHVHRMISIPPRYAVSEGVGYIKGQRAIHLALCIKSASKISWAGLLGARLHGIDGGPRRNGDPGIHSQPRRRKTSGWSSSTCGSNQPPLTRPNINRGRVSAPRSSRFERLRPLGCIRAGKECSPICLETRPSRSKRLGNLRHYKRSSVSPIAFSKKPICLFVVLHHLRNRIEMQRTSKPI